MKDSLQQNWSLTQAFFSVAGVAAALIYSNPTFVLFAGTLNMLWLPVVFVKKEKLLNLANLITALRLFLLFLPWLLSLKPLLVAGSWCLFLALDGLDGWFARKKSQTTEFGTLFDMESDALFVSYATTYSLLNKPSLGFFILAPTFLRVAFVFCRSLLSPHWSKEPRYPIGRYLFFALATALFLNTSELLPPYTSSILLYISCFGVACSFAFDFVSLFQSITKAKK